MSRGIISGMLVAICAVTTSCSCSEGQDERFTRHDSIDASRVDVGFDFRPARGVHVYINNAIYHDGTTVASVRLRGVDVSLMQLHHAAQEEQIDLNGQTIYFIRILCSKDEDGDKRFFRFMPTKEGKDKQFPEFMVIMNAPPYSVDNPMFIPVPCVKKE